MPNLLTDFRDDESWGIPSDLVDEVKEELRYRKMMELSAAMQEQTLAARLGNERYCLEYGEQELMVHPVFYHYWGGRLGYECWQDPGFLHEFRRDNEICRVKNKSRKTTMFMGTIGPGMRNYFDKAKRRAAQQEKELTDGKGRVVARVKPDPKPALPVVGSEVGSQKSEVGSRESEVGSRKSGVRKEKAAA